jgi:hypothetical protein
MQVVETMKDGVFSAMSSAAIYDDCMILCSGFNSVIFYHCNREANQVAHELAKDACSSSNSCILVDELPSFILSKLANDVIVLSDG